MLDVAALVQQMRDTLSEIHDTITSLDTKGHDEKLDALESRRDEVFRQLQSAFEKESAELKQRRQAERDEIAEKRRREDEEIAARRRREDEEKASRDHDHDAERQHKLESERDSVEQETDEKMDSIEEQARRMLDEGHSKLKDLEERRREINRMIDEQMKAPLPPPPVRRARRSTRASQGEAPGQSDSDQQQERTARLAVGPQHPTQRPDVSDSRGVESEESKDNGLTHAEPKSAEPHPEPSSPEEASTEAKSSPKEVPQGQAAESVGLQQDLGNTPASHGGQSQLQDTVTESQPASSSDRGAAETVAEDNAPAADQVDRENRSSSSQAPDHAAPSSEKSDQPGIAALATTRSDEGPSVQETLAEEEPADESVNVKERKLDSDHGQDRPQGLIEAASIDTPSQSQDQALGAEKQGMDISGPDTAKQSTESSAAQDPQEAPSNHERPYSSDQLPPSEVSTTKQSAIEDESDRSRPQPTAKSDAQAENGGAEGSDHGGLLHGVAKGGAAEEYIRMAEAESGQEEPQVGRNTPATPEQDSSSGHGQQHQQYGGDSSRGIEEPGSIRVDTSTTEEETPGYTRQAEADVRPSSASSVADPVEERGRSPVGSEHGSGHLQSRDIESSVDQQEPRREPTPDQEKHFQSSSEHSELARSRNLDDSSSGHVQASARSPDSPDVGCPDGEQLQEPEYGEKLRSEIASPALDPQHRGLESTHPEVIEDGKSNLDEALVSDNDPSGPISAQARQEHHGDEQRGDPSRGEQEHPGNDLVAQFESDPSVQQDPSTSSLSIPATSSHDAQVGKDLSGSEDHGGFGGHESSQERQESQTSKDEHASGEGEEQLPRASSHDAPNVAEPGDSDALPHESASEHEPGDKRSDSGYETGMASSRNLDESTTTLHEGQIARGAEHSFASAPLEGEQEKTREPRPEQILEGSGKDVSPPSLGGEQDSGGHPVEETFDLSGSEPIPGTMTHGKDRVEDQGEGLTGEDVSLHGRSHQQPADDDGAVGATPGENQRSMVINDSPNNPDREESLPHEPPQQAGEDHAQTESQPIAHEADNIGSADSRSPGSTEEQPQKGSSQSAVGNFGQGASESDPERSDINEPERQSSAPNTGEAKEMHPQGDGAVVPSSQEQQASQPGDLLDSSNARDTSPDQLGSWNSQAFSRPADENEFSFKKRADSVQVGRSHGLADRGADLPSINTDGPNEDADEGLFAVPPTPRHEMEHEKSPQLQGDGESKPSSRASSRNGSTGGNTLSPRAAEGLGDPYSEAPDRASLSDTFASKEDMHQNGSQSQDDGPQANLDASKTPEGTGEQSPVPHDDVGRLSSRGEPDHGQPEGPVTMAAGQELHGASAGNDGSQQDHHHDDISLQASGEQPSCNKRLSDGSLQPETYPGEQDSDVMNRSEVIDENVGMQVGSGDQARDTSGDLDAQPSGSTKEYDLEQDGSESGYLGDSTQQPSDDAYNTRGEATEDLQPRDMTTEPESEQIRQQSGETDNKSLSGNDQVQRGETSESRTSEDQPRGVSPEVAETASDREVDEKNGDPPHSDQGGTQEPEVDSGSGREQLEQDHAKIGNAARPPSPPDRSGQHLDAQHASYDGEGYGVTPSSEYSNDPLEDLPAEEETETHSADTSAAARQTNTHSNDSPGSAGATRNDDPLDSGSETFETPLESADLRKPQEGSRSVTPGNFTRALDHLPDESAHTVQGTDDLFDDTDDADDAEDQDDYGEAVVYQNSNESAEMFPSGEKIVYSTRGDENNTALGGHRSSLSLGSVGHRSQGSISSMRDTTPVRPTFGSYIGGPNVVRADWAAEHEDELRPSSSLNPTPQLGPSTTHDTPEISPFALRNTPLPSNGSEQRGLTSSMWNPERPQTPTSATTQSNNPFATPQRQAESGLDASLFVPRDVTHVRQDSVPASLHSQTTLDSSWSSPVHSSLPVDRHEPVIRDSWPAPAPGYQQYLSSWSSRPRGDTTSTSAEYDPFKPEISAAPGGQTAAKLSSSYNPFLQRGRAESSVSAAPSNPSASNSPSRGSALFAKMRNIFEGQSPNGAGDVPASPGKTRPVSGVFNPVTSVQRNSQDSSTGQRDEERGGFLNEADHEIDERSAFLRSDGHPSGH